MNEDRPGPTATTIYSFDSENRLTNVTEYTGPVPTPEAMAARPTPAFSFEHDAQKGLFRLTWADGTVEVYRDRPARHLVVEPDPATGAMKPVLKRGNPTYLYLCREDRESR